MSKMPAESTVLSEKLRWACGELSRRLRAGELCRAEEFIRDVDLPACNRESVLELLYTEFVVRHELGQNPDPREWFRRFPQWQTDLEELFQIHRYVCQEDPRDPSSGETVGGSTRVDAHDKPRPTPIPSQSLPGYELLNEIGRGGMGVVYKARQLSVNRIVALKMILTGEHAGTDDYRRFANEAQAAASLHHPHIVQLFEAGEQDGRPFLAMEYVEGTSLDVLLAKAPLSLRAAAELVATLAEAIHYAHQRSVIHRDLKPSNVLFTVDGQAKISDFGLARRCEQSDESRVTRSGVVLGTPCYMPPEQATGDLSQLGPHSDVYALGAMLYETITGRPPYTADSLAEILQQIRASDPVRPSRLNTQLPRDLETICLKALEKDPRRRYQSAAQMGDDLRRFLSNQPIVARPATILYRLRKFATRNRKEVAGLATILLVLVAGVVATSIQAIRATQQKELAQSEADFATAVNTFLSDVFNASSPLRAGNDVTVRDALDRATRSIDQNPPNHPRVEAEIRETMGWAYYNLGRYQEAERHLTIALEKARQCYGEPHREVAKALASLGLILEGQAKHDAAERYLLEAIAMSRNVIPVDEVILAEALQQLAAVYDSTARFDAAESSAREAQVILARKDNQVGAEEIKINTLTTLAGILYHRKQLEEAKQVIQEAAELSSNIPDASQRRLALCRNLLAMIYAESGEIEKAVTIQREVIETNKRLMGEDHPEIGVGHFNLGMQLQKLKQYNEAEQELVQAWEIFERQSGPDHPGTLAARAALGHLFLHTARLDEAEPILRDVLERRLRVLGKDHPETATSLANLAGVYRRRGEYSTAAPLYQRAFDIRCRLFGADDPRTISAQELIAVNTYKSGAKLASEPLYREVYEKRLANLGADHLDTRDSMEMLARVLREIERSDEADALIKSSRRLAKTAE